MDRPTVFSGAIPRSVDVLRLGQSAMVGLAKLTEAVLGTGAVVDGFTLVPTSPASFSAVLSGGSIYQQENLEATAWSALPADNHTIVKQGLNLDPTTLTFAPPSTTGYAQCFLVEVQYLDSDTGAIVLPYYNAANPLVPYTGPGNAGTADNTVRKGGVSVQVKAGVAALAGTQVVPSPDAGWAGLYYVTLAAGATTVTSGNITQYPGAPFLVAKLGNLPSYIQNDSGIYCVDQGTTQNQIVVTPVPAIAAYQPGQRLKIKLIRAITGATTVNVSGLGARPLVRQSGTACVGGEGAVGDHIEVSVRDSDIQLIRLSVTDVSSSTATYISQNIQSISPQVFNSLQSTSTFTPVVVLSDLPYNVETVLKTLTITNASYIDAYGQVAYRNDNGSNRISYITKLRLVDANGNNTDAQYIGGGLTGSGTATAGDQIEQQSNYKFRGLDKTKTYTLQLIGFKIDNYSPLVVLDGFLRGDYA